jgi:sugar lactone lactonase YvrE
VPDPSIQVLRDDLAFPECARWVEGELWFVDTPYVSVLTQSGSLRRHAEIPSRLTLGLAMIGGGDVLVGDSRGRRVYRADEQGRVELFADLSDHFVSPTNEIALVTGSGSVYVATMGFDLLRGETPRTCRLARLGCTGEVASVGPEMLFPNGMQYLPHSRELVVAESYASRLTRLTAAEDGSLTWIGAVDVQEHEASHPDGISVDPEGGYWYADPRAGLVVRVDGSGAELGRISLPFRHPTSCALGGADGDTLFVTGTERMPTPDLGFNEDGAIARIPHARSLASLARP